MLRNLALLALAGLTSAVTFSGTGEVIALDWTNDGTTDGCLTDAGEWTTSDNCGTFTGVRDSDSLYFTISTSVGPCAITDLTFSCASGNTATTFWVSQLAGDFVFPSGGPVSFSF